MFDIGWLTSLKSNVLQNEPSLYGHTSKITIRRITSCCVSERNLITSKIELRDFQVLHFVRRASASSSLLIGVWAFRKSIFNCTSLGCQVSTKLVVIRSLRFKNPRNSVTVSLYPFIGLIMCHFVFPPDPRRLETILLSVKNIIGCQITWTATNLGNQKGAWKKPQSDAIVWSLNKCPNLSRIQCPINRPKRFY